MNNVSALDDTVGSVLTGSNVVAPGTATLVRYGGMVGLRSAHGGASGAPRVCGTPDAVNRVSIGGGHPGIVKLG